MRAAQFFFFCVSILLVAAALFGITISETHADKRSGTPDVVIAKEFRVVDSKNKTRISVGMFKGAPTVALYGGDGTSPTIYISTKGEMSTVSLRGSSGEALVAMSIAHERYRGVYLNDEKGNTFIGMGLNQHNIPMLWIGDTSTKTGIEAGIENTEPFIKITDKKRNTAWRVP